MNKEEYIKQRIIAMTIEHMSLYSHDDYDSLVITGTNLYRFLMDSTKVSRKAVELFQERLFNYVLYNEDTLTAEEIDHLYYYFGYGRKPLAKEYSEEVFERFRRAVQEHKAELQRLTEATAELRKLDKGCFPFSILERIGDYISYYEQVQPVDRLILYASIYNIGRVDGIRTERERRKARKAKADRKENPPHTTE